MERGRKTSGFTLLELILVLVIIALCAAMATPAMSGFARGRRLPNTAQALVTTLRWCHNQAISDSLTYRVNFSTDQDQSKFWITKDDGTGKNFVTIDSEFMRGEYVMPEGISLSTNIPSSDQGVFISFDSTGRTDLARITISSESLSVLITCDTPLGTYYAINQTGGGQL